MKTTAKLTQRQHTSGVRERRPQGNPGGKYWRAVAYQSPVKGHGSLEELERRLASVAR